MSFCFSLDICRRRAYILVHKIIHRIGEQYLVVCIDIYLLKLFLAAGGKIYHGDVAVMDHKERQIAKGRFVGKNEKRIFIGRGHRYIHPLSKSAEDDRLMLTKLGKMGGKQREIAFLLAVFGQSELVLS